MLPFSKSSTFQTVLICIITLCMELILILFWFQFEQLAFTWMERQKLGGSYSSHRAQSEKHVVVCSTTLHADTIMDFLNEFYAHPLLQVKFTYFIFCRIIRLELMQKPKPSLFHTWSSCVILSQFPIQKIVTLLT